VCVHVCDMHVCVCICVCVHLCVCERGRDRKNEIERKREREESDTKKTRKTDVCLGGNNSWVPPLLGLLAKEPIVLSLL